MDSLKESFAVGTEEKSPFVIAYGAAAFSGFIIGIVSGWLIWG